MKKIILIIFLLVLVISARSQNKESLKKFFIKPQINDSLTYKPSVGFKLSNKESKLFKRYNLTKTKTDCAKYSIYGANCGYVSSFNFNYKSTDLYYYDYNQNTFWQEIAKEIIIGLRNK